MNAPSPLPKPRTGRLLCLLVAGLAAASATLAQLRLPALFSEGMVLQRDRPVPVWGWGAPGETVRVEFAGHSVPAIADAAGRWHVILPPLPAASEPRELTVRGSSTLVVPNVLVGEVWLASGQSNMQWSVRQSADAEAEVAAGDHPHIREFAVRRATAAAPRDDVEGAWAVCSPETVAHFSAVAYVFARELQRELGVPVGIVHSSWGGTAVESWMSPSALAATPHGAAVAERWAQTMADYPAAQARFEEALAAWETAAIAARAAGTRAPGRPRAPTGPDSPHRPSTLHHAMIAPLVPYALRGVIWYQGESNVGRHSEYRALFTAMIEDWRGQWGQGDLPFYFVQLANFAAGNAAGDQWAHLREAQTQTLALPATGMVVTLDIGDSNDIHPRNKRDVGRRLAALALARLHGRERVDSGPAFDGAEREGAALRLRFRQARGLSTRDGAAPASFVIAGEDREFHPAVAQIEGDTVVLTSEAVAAPVAARHAWANDPQPPPNLINGAGLPAGSFRTDRW
jgi:sialate O-acetylesterase